MFFLSDLCCTAVRGGAGDRDRNSSCVFKFEELSNELCPEGQLAILRRPRKLRCFCVLRAMCLENNIAGHSCNVDVVVE